MNLNINAIETFTNILEYILAEEAKCATLKDNHIGALSTYVVHGWQSKGAEVIKKCNHTGPSEVK